MRKSVITFILCLLHIGLPAQEQYKGGFLFNKFEAGTVVNKLGTETKAYLNYDVITEQMLFMAQSSDSTILEFANPSAISEIKIGSRIFEHIKNGMFYERIVVGGATDKSFYIRWKSKILSEGKTGGYGIVSATGSIDNASQALGHSSSRNLQSTENYKMMNLNTYYLKINNKFKRIDSFSTLAKQFKNQEKAINEYVKKENLDFKNIEDVKKTIAYSYQSSTNNM